MVERVIAGDGAGPSGAVSGISLLIIRRAMRARANTLWSDVAYSSSMSFDLAKAL